MTCFRASLHQHRTTQSLFQTDVLRREKTANKQRKDEQKPAVLPPYSQKLHVIYHEQWFGLFWWEIRRMNERMKIQQSSPCPLSSFSFTPQQVSLLIPKGQLCHMSLNFGSINTVI